MIHIVTDSSCDLPEEYLKKHNISIVPLTIRFDDDKEYREKIDITPEEFYKKMAASSTLPKTAQPSPADFLKVFEEVAAPGDEILCITISSKLSGTFQSANLAKNMTSIPVTVFDSLAASPGHALQIMRAVELRDSGHSIDEIIADLTNFRDNEMRIFIYLKTVENIVKGGRITRFQGTLAKIMNIKLICEGIKGEVVPLEKVRGEKRALERLISLIGQQKTNFSDTVFYITHTENPGDAEFIKSELVKRYKPRQVLIYEIGPTVGTYTGPGGIVLTF
ncbi:DegV family protein [Tepidanaerobacter sp. GT38]|uniref:DegV family protein n=1 Tax=Tepidanaerobacter sp. GT38 TaxID=2722793 RepID=UPI001F3524A6|nr:DegV family protein [Tepidanaerobacter sp. GT38]MCG1012988.1 DegV family protein [Tepidanaerobacter sp. GT38]